MEISYCRTPCSVYQLGSWPGGTGHCSDIGQQLVSDRIVHRLSFVGFYFPFFFVIFISITTTIVIIFYYYYCILVILVIKLFLSQPMSFFFFRFSLPLHWEAVGESMQLPAVQLLAGVKPPVAENQDQYTTSAELILQYCYLFQLLPTLSCSLFQTSTYLSLLVKFQSSMVYTPGCKGLPRSFVFFFAVEV